MTSISMMMFGEGVVTNGIDIRHHVEATIIPATMTLIPISLTMNPIQNTRIAGHEAGQTIILTANHAVDRMMSTTMTAIVIIMTTVPTVPTVPTEVKRSILIAMTLDMEIATSAKK